LRQIDIPGTGSKRPIIETSDEANEGAGLALERSKSTGLKTLEIERFTGVKLFSVGGERFGAGNRSQARGIAVPSKFGRGRMPGCRVVRGRLHCSLRVFQ
jgi:hypothetical protein